MGCDAGTASITGRTSAKAVTNARDRLEPCPAGRQFGKRFARCADHRVQTVVAYFGSERPPACVKQLPAA
ncbi:conserved hypothetical protein [Ricinus communis]|uniref:Uncharacterized protein n=1 Tax=Ricinus communis TaxID=3988 RepID=B9T9F8_RICCO|nr:conserved hypothetical protein [Ricinus communis]